MSFAPPTIAAIRFGYGFHPDELPPGNAQALLDQVTKGAAAAPFYPAQSIQARSRQMREYILARKADTQSAKTKRLRQRIQAIIRQDRWQWVGQRVLSPFGFYERLVSFWADHFTVSAREMRMRFLAPMFEQEAIRPFVAGNFADMLIASTRHPVMLRYLDQSSSIGPQSKVGQRSGRGLNENLAREILELHSLGVEGPYTQTDVRAFAELLTGYTVAPNDGVFVFRPQWAQPGAEQVLGRVYGGGKASAQDAVDFLHTLARHEATALHLARKIATHFVTDDPPEELVNDLALAYREGDGALMPLYRRLLEHPMAWESFGTKIKQPLDFIVSGFRAIGFRRQDEALLGKLATRHLARAFDRMNQPYLAPDGPDGWPEQADAWITPQALAGRLEWAARMGRFAASRPDDTDPRRLARLALADALRPVTARLVDGAPERWEAIALLLASPEFNRR